MSLGLGSIGSTMAFCASAPATFDAAGYAALTWTLWDEVTNLGDIGPVAEVLKYNTVGTGKVHKRVGPVDEGSQSMEAAFDSANAGQILVKAAQKNRTTLYCRESLSSGDIFYYPSIVPSAPIKVGDASAITMLAPVLEITGDFIEVDKP